MSSDATLDTILDEMLALAEADHLGSGWGNVVISEATAMRSEKPEVGSHFFNIRLRAWLVGLDLIGSTSTFAYAPDRPRQVTDLQVSMFQYERVNREVERNLFKSMFPHLTIELVDEATWEIADFTYSRQSIARLELVSAQIDLVRLGGIGFGGATSPIIIESAPDGLIGAYHSMDEATAKAVELTAEGHDPSEIYLFWSTDNGGQPEPHSMSAVGLDPEPVLLKVRYVGHGYGEEVQHDSRLMMAAFVESDRIPESATITEAVRNELGEVELTDFDVYEWLELHGSDS